MDWTSWETNGDWTTDPWFLRQDESQRESEWALLGFPREKRQLAAHGLARIFPPDVCRTIRENPDKGFGLAIMLFGGGVFHLGMIIPLLELGVDAMAAAPWEDPSVLLRLQKRRSFQDAAFEVRVHAGLVRAGFQVSRVPESPTEKRHDFLVSHGTAKYEVEVKLVNASQLDDFARELTDKMRDADLIIPGLNLELRGSEKLTEDALDDLDEVKKNADLIVRLFADVGKRIRESPNPGTYQVEDYGQIIAKAHPGFGEYTDLTLPDLPAAKKAARVARKIRDGLAQLTEKHWGIVIVGVFHAAHPFAVESLILDAAAKDDAYKRACMIVLCDKFNVPPPPSALEGSHVPTGITPAFHAFAPRAYRRLRKKEMELATAAASTHSRKAVALRPAQPGGYALTMDTSRSATTVRSMGSVSLKPGGTSTFYFDGRPPVVSDEE